MMRNRGVGIGLVIAVVCGALGDRLPAVEPPDLTGSWELDVERSDVAAEKLDAARRAAEANVDSRRGRGGSGGSTRSGAMSGRPGSAPEETSSSRWAAELPRILVIEQEEPELRLSSSRDDSGFEATYYIDGRSFYRQGLRPGPVEATAAWQRGGRLRIEFTAADGRAVREDWELVAEGSRVLVTTVVGRRGLVPEVEFRRVYDRVEVVPWDVPD